MMNKRNERMEKLNNAGIDTNKYFTFELPEGLEPGTQVHLVFDNGELKAVPNVGVERDTVREQIIEDGYVRNTKLHRRFVTAKMFKMLNYKDWNGNFLGYNGYLNRCGYHYQFNMMLEEVRVLSKLEVRDRESFEERSSFFTKDVVVATCEDYMTQLHNHIDGLKDHKCKGIPYKKVQGKNIFVEDLYKKVYGPLQYKINRIKRARNYTEIYRYLSEFMKGMITLRWDTKKSAAWLDAYKGNGSFYTMKNLVMYHNCKFDGYVPRDRSMEILQGKRKAYKGEGWRMFACMKKLIADNNFDFNKAMKEKYGK